MGPTLNYMPPDWVDWGSWSTPLGTHFLGFLRDFDDLLPKEIIIAGSPQSVREQVQQAVDE